MFMKKLLKISLISSGIISIVVDIFVYLTSGINIAGSMTPLLKEVHMFITPLFYPPYVVTYFFGGSLLGLSGEITDLNTNIVFLIIEFVYLYIAMFFICAIILLIRKIFLTIFHKKIYGG